MILASPETATDAAFKDIERVIAHEYFHNWTGNRITCRDWFQLCLKEGLTVFRDQEFGADMRSAAEQRHPHAADQVDGGPGTGRVRASVHRDIMPRGAVAFQPVEDADSANRKAAGTGDARGLASRAGARVTGGAGVTTAQARSARASRRPWPAPCSGST